MTAQYQAALGSIRAIVEIPQAPTETVQEVMAAIRHHLPKYEWVGTYVLYADSLNLGPFVGADTAHTQIPVGRGVCGTAILRRHNRVVEDVRELTNYLSCGDAVRAEIVALIWREETILGLLDADSNEVGAFDSADEKFLAQVATLIAPAVAKLTPQ